MLKSSIATEAAYFQFGLEVALITEKEVKSWAFNLIEKLDVPPYEIIAVAESHDAHDLHKALSDVLGERDAQQAGKWLLGLIKLQLFTSLISPYIAAKKAMQVCKSTEIDESIYSTFDRIDDGFYLAVTKQYGTIQEISMDLISELGLYETFKTM